MLKQSTAVTVKIGPFIDDTDGKTAETGLTLSQADIRLSKNGGDIAQKNESSAATHDELGIYDCALDTTDTGTLGRLQLWVHEAGALPVWHEFMVLPANVWDSLFGSDKLQVHADEITAGLITAAAIATDAIDADAIKADAVTEIQSGLSTLTAQQVWEYGTRTLSSFGTLVADVAAAVWGAAARTLTAFGFTPSLDAAYDAAKTAAQPGDEMDLVDEPNSDAVGAIQAGLMTSDGYTAPDNTGIGNAAADAATAAAAATSAAADAASAKSVTDKLDTMIEATV
jgi:hypothetical protein